MPNSLSSPSGFTSSEGWNFLRWCAEFPITKITSVGAAIPAGTGVLVALHAQLSANGIDLPRLRSDKV